MKNLMLALIALVALVGCGAERAENSFPICEAPAQGEVTLRWAYNEAEGCCATKAVDSSELPLILASTTACEVIQSGDAYSIDCTAVTGRGNRPSNTRSSTCEWAGHMRGVPPGVLDSEYWLDH